MHLETAREAFHAKMSTPSETPRETVQAGKSTLAEKSGENKGCKNGDSQGSPKVNNKKAKSPDQRVPRPPPSKYTNFIDLTSSCEEVFLATKQTSVYKRRLDPLRGDHSKRN